MSEKIDVSATIREEIDSRNHTSISISEIYANQKTINLLKEIDEDGGDFDGDDWHVEEGYEDYVVIVYFRILVYLFNVYVDSADGSCECRVDSKSRTISIIR